jgi:hypothetical protein
MIFSFGSGSGFPSMKVNFHCNNENSSTGFNDSPLEADVYYPDGLHRFVDC